jgi:hypothetical protein
MGFFWVANQTITMSYVDGQLADFRGGRMGGPSERARVVSGASGQKVRYSFATGAVTPATALVLTLVGATPDPIGVLSGTNTWTPNDASSRYLVQVHLQTNTGSAAALAAAIETNSGTVVQCAGEAGVTGVMHLTLTTDAIDFTTALNLQVIPLVGAGVLGDPTGTSQAAVNHIDITRLSVQ